VISDKLAVMKVAMMVSNLAVTMVVAMAAMLVMWDALMVY